MPESPPLIRYMQEDKKIRGHTMPHKKIKTSLRYYMKINKKTKTIKPKMIRSSINRYLASTKLFWRNKKTRRNYIKVLTSANGVCLNRSSVI